MTDKEKAKEYAMQHSCPAINDGCIAVYKGVLCGIAEGRKEGARDIEVLTEENEELKKENAELKSDLERWKNRCAEIYWDS